MILIFQPTVHWASKAAFEVFFIEPYDYQWRLTVSYFQAYDLLWMIERRP